MSIGFIDAVCPPSSCYAAYNALRGKKTVINEPLKGSQVMPVTGAGPDSGQLRVRPGSDAYLLLALAKTIAGTEGLADSAFVRDKTLGFEELRKRRKPRSHRP